LFATELLDISLALGDVEQALSAYQSLRQRSPQNRLTWTPFRLRSQLQRTQQVESFSESLSEVLAASGTERAEWRDLAIELQTDLALYLNATGVFESWLTTPPPSLLTYWNASPGRKNDHLMTIAFELSTVGEDRAACEFFKQLDRAAIETRLEVVEAAARSSANIKETSASLEYWEILWNSKRSDLDRKQKAVLEIARLHLESFHAGKALEWLQRIPSRPRTESLQAERTFLEGLAYTQLHEKRRAVPLLQDVVELGRNHSAEALFWLAEWSLWQRDRDRALELYRDLLGRDPGQDLANECLWRLRHLGELDDDRLPAYCVAAFFEAGGEFSEAEENYRKLAASLGPCDLTDWVYYRIGKIKIESGNREDGFAQWRTLLGTCDNPTLVRLVRFEMADLAEDPLERDFENIALEAEDTLLGDLARKRMNQAPLTPRSFPEQMVP
jgi:tetratricopeptide (TPR) repeat protein